MSSLYRASTDALIYSTMLGIPGEYHDGFRYGGVYVRVHWPVVHHDTDDMIWILDKWISSYTIGVVWIARGK